MFYKKPAIASPTLDASAVLHCSFVDVMPNAKREQVVYMTPEEIEAEHRRCVAMQSASTRAAPHRASSTHACESLFALKICMQDHLCAGKRVLEWYAGSLSPCAISSWSLITSIRMAMVC